MQVVQIHLINHDVLTFVSPNKNQNIKAYYKSCHKNNDLMQITVEGESDTFINPNHVLYITVKDA